MLPWNSPKWARWPAEVGSFLAVSFSAESSFGLRRDGTVVAWETNGVVNAVRGLEHIVSLSSGRSWSFALTGDGHVVTWYRSQMFTWPEPGTDVIALSASGDYVVALRRDGAVLESFSGGPVNIHTLPST